jgi:hypothetical protein
MSKTNESLMQRRVAAVHVALARFTRSSPIREELDRDRR